MADVGVDWQGLLRWSLQFSDGTAPQAQRTTEDVRWFQVGGGGADS